MFKKILLGLVAAISLLAIVIALQPNSFTLSRSVVINAPASKAFAVVNDLHRWDDWSPWAKHDPQQKKEFGGAKSGVGATYAWEGNDKVGKGKQTIIESKKDELVKIELVFEKPFPANNIVAFTLAPEGQGSKLTWTMMGPSNFMSKFFVLSGMMEKMVGKDFEDGLNNLKALVEKK